MLGTNREQKREEENGDGGEAFLPGREHPRDHPWCPVGTLRSRLPLTGSGLSVAARANTPSNSPSELGRTKAREVDSQSSQPNFRAQTAKRRWKAGRDGSFTSIRDLPQCPIDSQMYTANLILLNLVNYFINARNDSTCPDLQLHDRRS